MPEINRSLGTGSAMQCNDHGPLHSHAMYVDSAVRVVIEDGSTLSREFPDRARGLILDWLEVHRDEFRGNWMLAKRRKPLTKISPVE